LEIVMTTLTHDQSVLTLGIDYLKSLSEAPLEIKRQIAGWLGEALVASISAGKVVHASGHDVECVKARTLANGIKLKAGDRIEVKTQIQATNGQCFAYSLSSKEGKCDYIALVDMTTNPLKPRISIIPTQELFDTAHMLNNKERMGWSQSYNKTDNKCVENTNLFLKYEVVY
jgi:hypothetical protein